jgi:hypothetical protein
LVPASWGQSECGELLDSDQDGFIGVEDLMNLLSLFGDTDADLDGIWDSVDDCVGVYDACGVCNGTGEDADEDGLCDDVDDCVGEYDECGDVHVCGRACNSRRSTRKFWEKSSQSIHGKSLT